MFGFDETEEQRRHVTTRMGRTCVYHDDPIESPVEALTPPCEVKFRIISWGNDRLGASSGIVLQQHEARQAASNLCNANQSANSRWPPSQPKIATIDGEEGSMKCETPSPSCSPATSSRSSSPDTQALNLVSKSNVDVEVEVISDKIVACEEPVPARFQKTVTKKKSIDIDRSLGLFSVQLRARLIRVTAEDKQSTRMTIYLPRISRHRGKQASCDERSFPACLDLVFWRTRPVKSDDGRKRAPRKETPFKRLMHTKTGKADSFERFKGKFDGSFDVDRGKLRSSAGSVRSIGSTRGSDRLPSEGEASDPSPSSSVATASNPPRGGSYVRRMASQTNATILSNIKRSRLRRNGASSSGDAPCTGSNHDVLGSDVVFKESVLHSSPCNHCRASPSPAISPLTGSNLRSFFDRWSFSGTPPSPAPSSPPRALTGPMTFAEMIDEFETRRTPARTPCDAGDNNKQQQQEEEQPWFRVELVNLSGQQRSGGGGANDDDGEFLFNIPDHLPSSPLCPAHPRHKSKGMRICPFHGRARNSSLSAISDEWPLTGRVVRKDLSKLL